MLTANKTNNGMTQMHKNAVGFSIKNLIIPLDASAAPVGLFGYLAKVASIIMLSTNKNTVIAKSNTRSAINNGFL